MKIGKLEISLPKIAAFIGIAILVFLVMDFNARLEELFRLQKQAETVRARATEIMQTQYNLQTAVAYANSDIAVQQWAREEAGLIQPGDVKIVPLPQPGATPQADPIQPIAIATPLSNWDVWMIVIFGE